jgi:chorismate--pyruvate lyase
MPLRERAMVRQIVMRLDGEPMVYARSVFPVSTLTGPLLRLRRLANQSLGAFLFARTDMRRSPFEVALLNGSQRLPACVTAPGQPVWARRSAFEVAGKPLLVSEVFLPGFPSWQRANATASLPARAGERYNWTLGLAQAPASQ